MLFLIFSLFLIPSGQSSSQSPDVVSSLIDISQAFVAGRHLSTELTRYLNNEELRLTKLRKLILRLDTALEICNASDVNQLAPPLIENKAAANPVSTFLTILQLAANWSNELSVILGVPDMGSDEVDSVSHKDIPVGVYEEFDSRRKLFYRLKWYADMLPDDGDVRDALNAVIRLQQTYNIPSIKIAEGRILPSSPSPRLSDWQCMKLGLFCYESGDYGRATEWYNVVLDRLNERKREGKLKTEKSAVSYATVYDHLSYALGRSGRYKEALEITKKLLIEDPTSNNGAMSKAFYEIELGRLNENDPPHVDDESERAEDKEILTFDELCRMADTWSPPKSKLCCRYSTPHPYFLIGPLMEEIVNEDPLILLWHDFVTQKEVDEIVELARPNLRRALIRNPESGVLEPATYRVTKKQVS
ncbi:unnamed protein product [Hymenolepis diminuta]|uniref:Uncharacterized protein n=1 Tax=Hymenolepis diminuta TaxID=6216 RepID=A0A564Y9L0_HYMDI|nr:unnamed protein product [Hymenolepis diminuta]